MKFIISNLLQNEPNAVTGEKQSTSELLKNTIEQAVYAEKLGFDGYGIGERHGSPFIYCAENTPDFSRVDESACFYIK